MDTSWINLIHEIGYEFTSSVEECKNHLCSRERERAEVQAKDVAKIVGLMCRRHSSLLDCNVNLPTPANFWPGQGQGQSQGGQELPAVVADRRRPRALLNNSHRAPGTVTTTMAPKGMRLVIKRTKRRRRKPRKHGSRMSLCRPSRRWYHSSTGRTCVWVIRESSQLPT